MYFDYFYGHCSDDGWISCPTFDEDPGKRSCWCDSDDDVSNGWSAFAVEDVNHVREAESKKLGAILSMGQIYNIELRTYKNGELQCRIATTDSGIALTDDRFHDEDLLVWGSTDVSDGKGEDRNGNLIFGQYGDQYKGKKPPHADEIRKKHPVVFKNLFPDGKVQDKEFNGEGCMDSPTWVECGGIRVYYCGHRGGRHGNDKSEYYFHKVGNELHSKAGSKFMIIFDDKLNSNVRNENGGVSSISKKGGGMKIREKAEGGGVFSYIGAGYDYFTQNTWVGSFMDVAADTTWAFFTGGQSTWREYEDRRVICYDGQPVGETGIPAVKCDPEDEKACVVCDFNMPQETASSYDGLLKYIAGYGDPQYLVYFEAFPFGEEEPWQLDELSLGLETILITNTAMVIAPGIAKRIGKGFTKLIKGTGRLARRAKYVDDVARAAEAVYGAVAKQTRKVRLIKRLKMKGKDIIKTGMGPSYYRKLFAKSDDILKHVDDDVLKIIGSNADEVAEAMVKGNSKRLDEIRRVLGGKGVFGATDDMVEGAISRSSGSVVMDMADEAGERAYTKALKEGASLQAAKEMREEAFERIMKSQAEALEKLQRETYEKVLKETGSEKLAKEASEKAMRESAEKTIRKNAQSMARQAMKEAMEDPNNL